jgi:hypothetical protein
MVLEIEAATARHAFRLLALAFPHSQSLICVGRGVLTLPPFTGIQLKKTLVQGPWLAWRPTTEYNP